MPILRKTSRACLLPSFADFLNRETAASTSHIYCPKCGGTRFNVYNIPESPEGTPEPVKIEEEKSFSRKSLFGNDEIQKEFTTPCNEFEKNLKQF